MNHTTGFYWTPSNNSLNDQLDLLEHIGTRAVFIPHRTVGQVPLGEIRSRGIQLYVDFSLFVDESWWHEFPDSVPIDSFGNPLERDGWYVPVCPNHPQVRSRNLEMLSALVRHYGEEIDGIWLDFVRYPVRWEVKQPSLQQTCFCEHCVNLFLNNRGRGYSKEETREYARLITGRRLDEWIDWKCGRIVDFVKDVRSLISTAGASIQLGVFSLPWRQNDYGGAIRSIAGQDLARLSEHVDVISPMTYHKLCYQPTQWIRQVILDVHQWTKNPVLPVVQSLDLPAPMSPSEFDDALACAIDAPAAGVMVFTLEPLLNNASKLEVAIDRFRQLQRI